MDFGLEGKVALVTGGGRGIGRACACALGREGAAVAVNFVNDRAAAEATAEAIRAAGGAAEAVQGDVSRFDQAEKVVQATLRRFGRLDVLVNNAGLVSRKSILEVPLEEWHRVVQTNLNAVFYCSRLAGAHMAERGSGRIISISSIHGRVAKADMGAYCATKGGVNMFTRQLAVELAPRGVTVNAIAPGPVATDINPLYSSTAPADQARLRAVLSHIPAGRVGRPDDVGAMAAFLASEAAAYVTGVVIEVDGGYVAEGTPRVAAG